MESVNSKVKQSKPTKEQSHLKVLQIGFNCSWHFMCLLCCRHAHLNLLSVSIASMTQEEAISTWVVWKSKPLFPKNVVKCWWVLSEFLSQYTGALFILKLCALLTMPTMHVPLVLRYLVDRSCQFSVFSNASYYQALLGNRAVLTKNRALPLLPGLYLYNRLRKFKFTEILLKIFCIYPGFCSNCTSL